MMFIFLAGRDEAQKTDVTRRNADYGSEDRVGTYRKLCLHVNKRILQCPESKFGELSKDNNGQHMKV
jgi:hypothetical protein